jgi:outer membrane protein OmpA-like peptidoglycan-associated protein
LLDAITDVIKAHPELLLLEVDGHTDNTGTPAFNRRLSQQRAEAVVKALVERGIDPARLRARGYGASRPLAPNVNAKNREKNRRVEIKVIERGGGKKGAG